MYVDGKIGEKKTEKERGMESDIRKVGVSEENVGYRRVGPGWTTQNSWERR